MNERCAKSPSLPLVVCLMLSGCAHPREPELRVDDAEKVAAPSVVEHEWSVDRGDRYNPRVVALRDGCPEWSRSIQGDLYAAAIGQRGDVLVGYFQRGARWNYGSTCVELYDGHGVWRFGKEFAAAPCRQVHGASLPRVQYASIDDELGLGVLALRREHTDGADYFHLHTVDLRTLEWTGPRFVEPVDRRGEFSALVGARVEPRTSLFVVQWLSKWSLIGRPTPYELKSELIDGATGERMWMAVDALVGRESMNMLDLSTELRAKSRLHLRRRTEEVRVEIDRASRWTQLSLTRNATNDQWSVREL